MVVVEQSIHPGIRGVFECLSSLQWDRLTTKRDSDSNSVVAPEAGLGMKG